MRTVLVEKPPIAGCAARATERQWVASQLRKRRAQRTVHVDPLTRQASAPELDAQSSAARNALIRLLSFSGMGSWLRAVGALCLAAS